MGTKLCWLILCDEWTGLVAQIAGKTLFLGVSLKEVLEEISISLNSVWVGITQSVQGCSRQIK